MGGTLTSLIAVFGTLAGATLTFFFQRFTTRRVERYTRTQQMWQERIAAYSDFAAALTDFRRSQNDRWHLEQADPQSTEFIAAREESYKLRATATAALCRVRLISGSAELGRLAQDAIDVAVTVHLARDEQERATRGERARLAVDRFVSEASAQVQGELRISPATFVLPETGVIDAGTSLAVLPDPVGPRRSRPPIRDRAGESARTGSVVMFSFMPVGSHRSRPPNIAGIPVRSQSPPGRMAKRAATGGPVDRERPVFDLADQTGLYPVDGSA